MTLAYYVTSMAIKREREGGEGGGEKELGFSASATALLCDAIPRNVFVISKQFSQAYTALFPITLK